MQHADPAVLVLDDQTLRAFLQRQDPLARLQVEDGRAAPLIQRNTSFRHCEPEGLLRRLFRFTVRVDDGVNRIRGPGTRRAASSVVVDSGLSADELPEPVFSAPPVFSALRSTVTSESSSGCGA